MKIKDGLENRSFGMAVCGRTDVVKVRKCDFVDIVTLLVLYRTTTAVLLRQRGFFMDNEQAKEQDTN